MKINKLTAVTAALAASLSINAPRILAQDATPAPSASAAPSAATQNGGGNRGGGNQQDFRQRMNDRLKTALKVTDQEWAVIQPLLEKVQEKLMASMSGRGGPGGFGGGRRGGPGGPGGQGGNATAGATAGGNNNQGGGPGRGGSPESQALRTALDTDSTPADEIKTKLQALRDSRKKAEAELETAREDLKKVLTLKQEATLVMMGVLD
jgi:hypothetical protein